MYLSFILMDGERSMSVSYSMSNSSVRLSENDAIINTFVVLYKDTSCCSIMGKDRKVKVVFQYVWVIIVYLGFLTILRS